MPKFTFDLEKMYAMKRNRAQEKYKACLSHHFKAHPLLSLPLDLWSA